MLTPPRQLHSLGGLTGIVEQMKQRFGDTEGFRLVVYPEYASLDRPDYRPKQRLAQRPTPLPRCVSFGSLVSRTRSSHDCAASSFANFGFKGTLES